MRFIVILCFMKYKAKKLQFKFKKKVDSFGYLFFVYLNNYYSYYGDHIYSTRLLSPMNYRKNQQKTIRYHRFNHYFVHFYVVMYLCRKLRNYIMLTFVSGMYIGTTTFSSHIATYFHVKTKIICFDKYHEI